MIRRFHPQFARPLLIGLLGLGIVPILIAEPDAATKQQLRRLKSELDDAMRVADRDAITRISSRAAMLLGDDAGIPEVPDALRPVNPETKPLSGEEIRRGFDRYRQRIPQARWWKIGLDPTKTPHLPRELATILEGCLLARALNPDHDAELLKVARDIGDFLKWAQKQGGRGCYPFPAARNQKGRPFEVAEQFLRKAEADGKLDELLHQGWVIDDWDDGGLQFDNGLAGVAMFHLAEATGDAEYRQSAIRAADWAISRRIVTNWNYNSFSVYLLAEAYRVTQDRKYLEAAKTKARLGVIPGQLRAGKHRGRWADAHNARPAYHYIMIRGLAALSRVLPVNDPDANAVRECLQLALLARNPDFQRGILNAESTVEALWQLHELSPAQRAALGDCQIPLVWQQLERSTAEGMRAGRYPLSPGAMAALLRFLAESRQRPASEK